MCSPDSLPSASALSPDEAAQAASACLSEVGSSLTETAARLREAIEAGTVPPKAAARMIARLEEVAAKASGVSTPPQE
jgi:hypothetical protein